MPAVSQAQQSFMGMVKAYQEGKMKHASSKIKKAARSMTHKAASDFAHTKRKGLPKKVKEGVGHSVPVEDMVRELKRLVDQHERAVLAGRDPSVLDDLEQAIEQLQAAIEQRQREIQTEKVKSTSFKQFLEEAITMKDIAAGEQRMAGSGQPWIGQKKQAQTQAQTEALKTQAIEAAQNVFKFIAQIGPAGEQALLQAFKALGPDGERGAALYNMVKAQQKPAVQPAAQPAQPAAQPAAQPNPQARAAVPVTAAYEITEKGKKILTEVWGAGAASFVKGAVKTGAEMAAQRIGQYGAGNEAAIKKMWQAGKEAKAAATAKAKGTAQPATTQTAQAAPQQAAAHPQAEQIATYAKQLTQLAVALTKAQPATPQAAPQAAPQGA